MRRGFTLVEVLVYGVVLAVASSSLMYLMITLVKTQTQTTAIPTAQAQAQDAIAGIAAFLRRAPLCAAESGCTGVVDSAFKTADPTTVTVYSSPQGDTVTFSNTGGALVRTSGGTSVDLIGDSLTLKLEYLLSPELTYTMASQDTYTWLNTVTTAANMKAIVAVKITATVERDGATSVQTSIVRLRNSPKKVFTTS
jgi:type II secretory pathway pseudopilin PulG